MTQLLEDLFWGNIRPNETCHVDFRLSEKTKKALFVNEEKLLQLLEGKEKEYFVDFCNAQSELTGSTAVEHFICGFRLGARLFMELAENHSTGY